MSSFRDNLRVIPWGAWITGLVFYVALATLAHFMVPTDREMSQWPLVGQLAFTFLMPLAVFPLIAIWGYVYGDARRRHMNAIGWTLLAVLIPYLIGLILYFILRDPLPADCPGCHQIIPAKYVFCPNCGRALRPHCPHCGKAVERNWVNCGFCGTKLPT
ncbi:MAG TPA: zinc ribbon domain-containing protein [Candidatus Acidoferrales bacterium]|nr:zinc ribbon domain-containing protein [Candidatus Acidoferrales bacterium]